MGLNNTSIAFLAVYLIANSRSCPRKDLRLAFLDKLLSEKSLKIKWECGENNEDVAHYAVRMAVLGACNWRAQALLDKLLDKLFCDEEANINWNSPDSNNGKTTLHYALYLYAMTQKPHLLEKLASQKDAPVDWNAHPEPYDEFDDDFDGNFPSTSASFWAIELAKSNQPLALRIMLSNPRIPIKWDECWQTSSKGPQSSVASNLATVFSLKELDPMDKKYYAECLIRLGESNLKELKSALLYSSNDADIVLINYIELIQKIASPPDEKGPKEIKSLEDESLTPVYSGEINHYLEAIKSNTVLYSAGCFHAAKSFPPALAIRYYNCIYILWGRDYYSDAQYEMAKCYCQLADEKQGSEQENLLKKALHASLEGWHSQSSLAPPLPDFRSQIESIAARILLYPEIGLPDKFTFPTKFVSGLDRFKNSKPNSLEAQEEQELLFLDLLEARNQLKAEKEIERVKTEAASIMDSIEELLQKNEELIKQVKQQSLQSAPHEAPEKEQESKGRPGFFSNSGST